MPIEVVFPAGLVRGARALPRPASAGAVPLQRCQLADRRRPVMAVARRRAAQPAHPDRTVETAHPCRLRAARSGPHAFRDCGRHHDRHRGPRACPHRRRRARPPPASRPPSGTTTSPEHSRPRATISAALARASPEGLSRCAPSSMPATRSDSQREASIEDQVRLCRALRRGGRLAAGRRPTPTRRSAAPAGCGRATRSCWTRSGAAGSMWSSAEALDRLARPGGHRRPLQAAGLRRRADRHAAEGEIGELHVGLKGTMNALFLKDWR